jgi:hypothetical protein
MRKSIFAIVFSFTSIAVFSQEFGLSFSYFLPKNGYFSTPISPFSFRGLGVNLNKFIALETGISLYRMSGLNIIDTPLETRDPMAGPNFTFFVPGELVLELGGRDLQFDIKGGGFIFYGLAQKLNYGHIDRAIQAYENWDVANADLTFKTRPGFGFHFGAEITVYVMKQYGVSLEGNYLIGSSKLPLTGSYTGGTPAGLQTRDVDFTDAKIDFTGLEVSIGVFMRTGRR